MNQKRRQESILSNVASKLQAKASYLSRFFQVINKLQIESLNDSKTASRKAYPNVSCQLRTKTIYLNRVFQVIN